MIRRLLAEKRSVLRRNHLSRVIILNCYVREVFVSRVVVGNDDVNSTNFVEEDLSAQEMIDFSPVYRCLHISAVLGSRATFEAYYRSQRTKQARLVLQPPTNMVRHFCLVKY